jgi:tape measure domain-containing protein
MIIGDMEIRLRADIARLQRDMDDARRVVGNAVAGMARAADLAKNALAGIAGAASLSKIAELSDEYSKFTAQLRLATDGTRAYSQAYADVKRIANSSQTDLSATGALYASLSRATKDLGTSQKSVANITESVNLALKVSGAGAQESAGAILQLSQAFASGSLRGDEFNSVNEAAPRLMKALADNIGVPVGALRSMAEQGKLTADLVAKTLPQALDQLRSEASQIQTIAGAFTVLKNNVMEFTGAQAQASGLVAVLTSGIGFLNRHHFSRYSAAVRNAAFQTRLETAVH